MDEVLLVQSLHAGYDKLIVLNGVDLEVARGEWLALLGPNASGKTTLLHCVAGMLAPRQAASPSADTAS